MTYFFTGPGWAGTVPKGMTHISFPTRYMVVLGRTYAQDTNEDLERVNALQAQYKVMPLSAYGKPYTFVAPPVDPDPGFSMTEKPQAAILALGTTGYFNLMTKLMGGAAPPAPEDAPMLARIAKIGIVPGEPFDPGKLDPAVQAALKNVPQLALEKMPAAWSTIGKNINGWQVTLVGGRYGTNYLERGAWATTGWPSQLPAVSLYPTTLRRRTEAGWREQIHDDLLQRAIAAGQTVGVLVDHDVHDRQWPLVLPQSVEQTDGEPTGQAEVQPRRIAHALFPA